MVEYFPRLLVATEAPPNGGGGGAAIIRQMLRGWPQEKITWWCYAHEANRHYGQQVASIATAWIPRGLYPNRRWRSQRSWLLEHIWTPWLTHHFRKTIRAFQPEVVWAIPHCWSIPPLARVLPGGKTGFHVSIHDYADIDSSFARFGVARSQRLARLADGLYAAATTRDAICQPMVDDLRARTGSEGTVARAGLEEEDFVFLQTASEKSPEEIRIAYAGTIIVEKDFAVFLRALERIRSQLGRRVTMEFFGGHSYRSREWFAPAWMKEHGNLPLPELSSALKKCTWGFSPMGLADDNPRYNRFSLPTKFASYLAAGLPIITMGHPESSVVKMATAHEVGVCVTTPDVEAMSAQLHAALSEPEPGRKYREGIRRCALAEFESRRMRAHLHECFRRCAARTVGEK